MLWGDIGEGSVKRVAISLVLLVIGGGIVIVDGGGVLQIHGREGRIQGYRI